jgi:hypothetical protein
MIAVVSTMFTEALKNAIKCAKHYRSKQPRIFNWISSFLICAGFSMAATSLMKPDMPSLILIYLLAWAIMTIFYKSIIKMVKIRVKIAYDRMRLKSDQIKADIRELDLKGLVTFPPPEPVFCGEDCKTIIQKLKAEKSGTEEGNFTCRFCQTTLPSTSARMENCPNCGKPTSKFYVPICGACGKKHPVIQMCNPLAVVEHRDGNYIQDTYRPPKRKSK